MGKAPLCMSLLSPFFSLPSTSFSPPHHCPGVLTQCIFQSCQSLNFRTKFNSLAQHTWPQTTLRHLFPSFFYGSNVYLFIGKPPQSLDRHCLELSAVMKMFSLCSVQHGSHQPAVANEHLRCCKCN